MRFIVIDLETANPQMSSICQIGIVTFEGGQEVDAEMLLVNPQDYFDPYHVAIHGITNERVATAPPFSEIHTKLCERTTGQIVACHTHFDRVALAQACGKYSLDHLSCNWLDTSRVARRAFSQFSRSGYGLANLANHFGISFKHHDALQDARTAGLILLKAIEETGVEVEDWVSRSSQTIGLGPRPSFRRDGDGDGPLVGESICFTGALQVPRSMAADMAHEAGAAVESGVTKKTTLLVVGDQDIAALNGQDKSGKHRKAEQLIEAGQQLRILCEADFLSLCRS